MVRVKAKKQKGDDAFKTRKQKVGRKKLAPATATRAEVHARTLHITTAPALARVAAAGAVDSSSSSDRRDARDKQRGAAAAQSVAELLVNAQHYRAAVRVSAFAALTRLLQQQQRGSSTTTTTHVSALDRLHALSAALEAVTDTDADVRRGALCVVRQLLRRSQTQPPPTRGGRAYGDAHNSRGDGGDDDGDERADAMSCERAVAMLHTVYIAITHAMQPVRLCGVELLALLLPACTRDVLRRAIARVCAQQRALVVVVAADAVDGTAATTADGYTKTAAGGSAECDEEAWMVALLRRVSTLTLRGGHVDVLASLTEALLPSASTLTRSERHHVGAADDDNDDDDENGDGNSNDDDDDDRDDAGVALPWMVWRQPWRVRDLLDEQLPQWGGYWRELMELRLGLLRHDDKLAAAIALTRVFAAVLTFLTEQQQQQQQQQQRGGGGGSDRASPLLSRRHLRRLQELFVGKVPVTMQEIMHSSNHKSSSSSSSSTSSGAGSGGRRHALALALARVCTPLAHTDEGWRILQHYFSVVFAPPPPPPAPHASATTATTRHVASRRTVTTTTALLQAVRVYCAVLRLYAPYDACVTTPTSTAYAARTCSSHNDDDDDDDEDGEGNSEQRRPRCRNAAQTTARCLRAVCHTALLQSAHVLQAITRHAHRVAAGEASADVLETLLYDAGEVLHACVQHTRTATPSSSSSMNASSVHDNSSNSNNTRLVHVMAQAVQLVPFLLYSLCRRRTQRTSSNNDDNHNDTHDVDDARVDGIVHYYLRMLCHLSSSAHPALALVLPAQPHDRATATTTTTTATKRNDKRHTRTTLADALCSLLRTLFGVRIDGAVREGVLARCRADTIALARHTLYYLAASRSPAAHADVQRLRQVTLLPVLRHTDDNDDNNNDCNSKNNDTTTADVARCVLDDAMTLLALHPALCATAAIAS